MCRSLTKKGIPAIYNRSNLIFSGVAENDESVDIIDYASNELAEFSAKGSAIIDNVLENRRLVYSETPMDYRNFIYSCLRAFHQAKDFWFHQGDSGIKVNFDKIHLGQNRPQIVRGVSLQIDAFRIDRLMLWADAFADLIPSGINLSSAQFVNSRKYSMPPPKERYEYVKRNIQKIFQETERIAIKIPNSSVLVFEKIEFTLDP